MVNTPSNNQNQQSNQQGQQGSKNVDPKKGQFEQGNAKQDQNANRTGGMKDEANSDSRKKAV